MLSPQSTELPIYSVLDALKKTLPQHPTVLLSAEPGAGKTTVVPTALLHEPWLQGQKILLLEPRRMAARNAARFMAQSLNESVGQTVGYRLRLEQKISPQTRIEVVTEGILTRLLQEDSTLAGYGLIIFDEFHERHLHADLGLALTLSCQSVWREDLKILIMSATLDESQLAQLNAPLLRCAGQSFALQTHYRPAPLHNSDLIAHCSKVITEARRCPGDLLVFLPGVQEIQRLQMALAELPNALVLPLHGNLSDGEQQAALAPAPEGKQKIILATNIAESSLTIDGVRTVVDSGLMRRNEFDPSSGLSTLKTRFIAQSSATQRAGRAARQADGQCFRLWSESQHTQLAPHVRAEITSANLAPLCLELHQWGESAEALFWLDTPPPAALAQGQDLLALLGLLNDKKTGLSDHGKACCRLGIEPRFAHALLSLHALGQGQVAAQLIALIQEHPVNQRYSDDLLRLFASAPKQPWWQTRILPLVAILKAKLPRNTGETSPLSVAESAALLIALAYPDRLAKKRGHNEQFLLANGKGARLQPNSDLITQDFLACADFSVSKDCVIRLATAFPDALLSQLESLAPQLFHQQTHIGFQPNGQHLAQVQKKLGSLVIASHVLPKLNAEQWQAAWLSYFTEQGLGALRFSDDAQQLRARLSYAHEHAPADWPAVDDEALQQNLANWLLPELDQARHLRDIEKIDCHAALLDLLSWPQRQALDRLLPATIAVPSGSMVAIDYQHRPPVLAVKLQEMFGYQGQPSVLEGNLALMIHLLSPARHPLQVTRDLPHFWRHGYAEVCKEMRGRYPKHPWPDDPLAATATKLTKKRLQESKQ